MSSNTDTTHTSLYKELYTEAEAAHILGVSRSYLRHARMDGHRGNGIPAPNFTRIGSRTIRYKKEAIDQFLEQLADFKHRNIALINE